MHEWLLRRRGVRAFVATFVDGIPDTTVPDPGDPQALNRYSYVLNNPIKYRDPSGHCVEMGISPIPCVQVMDFATRVWQQVRALVVQYGPQVIQGIQQFGNQIPALVD